jgi:hypothetical protein
MLPEFTHPSVRAAIAHGKAKERRPDGQLCCAPCRERTKHGTSDGYTNWRCRCKSCRDEFTRIRENANKYSARVVYQRSWANELQQWKSTLKFGKECADCDMLCTSENFPMFDWDHLPGTQKLFSISAASRAKSTILAEIAKCELVCANCHRMRTWYRRWGNQYGVCGAPSPKPPTQ